MPFSNIQAKTISIQTIENEITKQADVKLKILRLDNIHAGISGNKWFKLKYNIEEAFQNQCDTLVSFGGAYSNHLYALACLGNELGYQTIGIVRGDENFENATLKSLQSLGMKLIQVPRNEYKTKESNEFYEKYIQSLPGDKYVIPEGGTNSLALKGVSEIWNLIPENTNFLITAVGTGGTLAGLASVQKLNTKLLGIVALKGAQYIENEIRNLSNNFSEQLEFNHNFHFGGFGKYTAELIDFILSFEKEFKIPLEQVYTAKTLWATFELIRNQYFPPQSEIVVLHTGGLQGRLSILNQNIDYNIYYQNQQQ